MSDQKTNKSNNCLNQSSQNQNNEECQPIKNQEGPNNYSFNSYHMNIINPHHGIQGLPISTPLYGHQTAQYINFFAQPRIYEQPSQSPTSEIQMLLTNMFGVLNNQSNLLAYLLEKNEQNFSTTNKIFDQLKTIKKQEVEEVQRFGSNHFNQSNLSNSISSNDLVSILYGPKSVFTFKLVVDESILFQPLLYRQRNFKLKINLIDENGKLFANTNKIPISLALYTVENPPKFLQTNTLGNKMLKGQTQQDLVNGVCAFQKVQIKQVTSHYSKNMLFLVAFAKMPSLGCIKDGNFVDYTKIRPLVIDRVIVKAKKMKTAQQSRFEKQANIVLQKGSPNEQQEIIEGDLNQ